MRNNSITRQLLDGKNVKGEQVDDLLSIRQEIGVKLRDVGKVLTGADKTIIFRVDAYDDQLYVGARMTLKQLEAVVKEARKRMERFKKLGRERGNRDAFIFTHLGPDLTIM